MGKITGNEPAMPLYDNGELISTTTGIMNEWMKNNNPLVGLTIRQHFAAMAMQGILSGASSSNEVGIYVNGGYIHIDTVTTLAVNISDHLIAELNKNN